MWQNNKKTEQQDAEVVDFDEFVLVVRPCTVPFLSRKRLKEFPLTESRSRNL